MQRDAELLSTWDDFGDVGYYFDSPLRRWKTMALGGERGRFKVMTNELTLQTLRPHQYHMLNPTRFACSKDITEVAVALERFRLEHGDFPKSLDELVPDYFDSSPVSSVTGEPIGYRDKKQDLNEDGYFLFSYIFPGETTPGYRADRYRSAWLNYPYVVDQESSSLIDYTNF